MLGTFSWSTRPGSARPTRAPVQIDAVEDGDYERARGIPDSAARAADTDQAERGARTLALRSGRGCAQSRYKRQQTRCTTRDEDAGLDGSRAMILFFVALLVLVELAVFVSIGVRSDRSRRRRRITARGR